MSGEERRKMIVHILKDSKTPVSGVALAKELKVSRQVIVQDIALLRAADADICSTYKGYILQSKKEFERVLKVVHDNSDVENELGAIVDMGGRVKDVFVYHKVYGVVRAELNIRSRHDIDEYMKEIKSGKSSLLMNVTSGYHYHTVAADSEAILDLVQNRLQQLGFLAKLQEYEPVDFWNEK
ncbi:MAG: transcription repressor NadR [Eubacteriales bacterium]|nr:transcription repressor NadR [Eubacteriales bacterium]